VAGEAYYSVMGRHKAWSESSDDSLTIGSSSRVNCVANRVTNPLSS